MKVMKLVLLLLLHFVNLTYGQANCKDGRSTYTSEKFTVSADCKKMCKCSVTTGLSCISLCPVSLIKCSNGHTNISYKERPLKDSKCLCQKEACVRPENSTVNPTTKENVILNCSFPDMPWTFDGKRIENVHKYKMNRTSLEIKALEYADNGVYSCNDGKTYFLNVSKDEISFNPRNSGTSKNVNAVLIVVCSAVVVLVLAAVIFILVKRIYRHREITKENQNTHQGENSVGAKKNEAFYSELTSKHVPSQYSELNIDSIKTSNYGSHVYEINPYVIGSQCERYAVPATYISLGDINDENEQRPMEEQYEISPDLIFGRNRHSFSLPPKTDIKLTKVSRMSAIN